MQGNLSVRKENKSTDNQTKKDPLRTTLMEQQNRRQRNASEKGTTATFVLNLLK
eukprot:m.111692 g.111692  ORF g.111692 m.111692 type:complete len:54 (-) comp16130_c0_seq1:19-180(-)